MQIENRERKRFNPEGLMAHIIIDPLHGSEIIIEGQVVDMSYGGIKIKLKEPFLQIVEEAELRISLVLPESKVPVSIHGMIKHIEHHKECGLQYTEEHGENDLDELMFECVKFAPPHLDE